MSIALNIIAKTSSILMAAAVVCILLRRASAATRHTVWVLAIVSVLLLPFAAAVVPALQLPVWPEMRSIQAPASAAMTTVVVATDRAARPSVAYSAADVMAVLWALGLGLLLARLLAGVLGVWRLAKCAETSEDESWREISYNCRTSWDATNRCGFCSAARKFHR